MNRRRTVLAVWFSFETALKALQSELKAPTVYLPIMAVSA